MSIKNTVYPIILAGKMYNMRFDIQALTSAQAALKAIGFGRPTIWQLADVPYDIPELVILLHAGLNGAKRLEKSAETYNLDEIQTMFQEHLDVMAQELYEIESEKEAMAEFTRRQQDFMAAISDAIKGAIGFRYKGKRDKPGKKE